VPRDGLRSVDPDFGAGIAPSASMGRSVRMLAPETRAMEAFTHRAEQQRSATIP
jgi:hypothetical protein